MHATGRLRPLFLANVATALRSLADAKETEKNLADSIPVVDLDAWATAHHPGLIKDAELRSGHNHHTTRRDITARMTTRTLRTRLR